MSAVKIDENEEPENEAEEAVVEEIVERRGAGDETAPDTTPQSDTDIGEAPPE